MNAIKKYVFVVSLFSIQAVFGYTNVYTEASIPTGSLVNDLDIECAVFTTKEPLYVSRSYSLQTAHILSGCWNLKTVVFFGPPIEYDEYGVGRIPAIPIIQEILVYADEIFYSSEYCDKWNKILNALSYKGRRVVFNGSWNSGDGWITETEQSTGFVVVSTEVLGTGGAVAIPQDWGSLFPKYTAMYGSDYAASLLKLTGKIDGNGVPMYVWQDYVAGTDPTEKGDLFKASVKIENGIPVISYTPELTPEQKALRIYKTLGKKKLLDEDWVDITDASGEEMKEYNFFKVTVEMK